MSTEEKNRLTCIFRARSQRWALPARVWSSRGRWRRGRRLWTGPCPSAGRSWSRGSATLWRSTQAWAMSQPIPQLHFLSTLRYGTKGMSRGCPPKVSHDHVHHEPYKVFVQQVHLRSWASNTLTTSSVWFWGKTSLSRISFFTYSWAFDRQREGEMNAGQMWCQMWRLMWPHVDCMCKWRRKVDISDQVLISSLFLPRTQTLFSAWWHNVADDITGWIWRLQDDAISRN